MSGGSQSFDRFLSTKINLSNFGVFDRFWHDFHEISTFKNRRIFYKIGTFSIVLATFSEFPKIMFCGWDRTSDLPCDMHKGPNHCTRHASEWNWSPRKHFWQQAHLRELFQRENRLETFLWAKIGKPTEFHHSFFEIKPHIPAKKPWFSWFSHLIIKKSELRRFIFVVFKLSPQYKTNAAARASREAASRAARLKLRNLKSFQFLSNFLTFYPMHS